tara:strand:- start:108 stop:1655 length:1548 start_codon:yes stop_codon:yes gene_type:complete
MSIHKSYFKKNNTILSNSSVNTAKNPVTELYYGDSGLDVKTCIPSSFSGDTCVNYLGDTISGYTSHLMCQKHSRYIFELNLTDLQEKVDNGRINLVGSCNNDTVNHIVRMVNTSFFDDELFNTRTSKNNLRATSFDLILFSVPQFWDEGVGYDYSNSVFSSPIEGNKTYSIESSNWYNSGTLTPWSTNGIYDYGLNPPTILQTQHFDNGNENIEMDITAHINTLLTASTSTNGYGIAFSKKYENTTGLTESYSVGFFAKDTQTFYEPFLETKFNDTIKDSRHHFYEGVTNHLYLHVNVGGIPTNSETIPLVNIYDVSGVLVGSQITSTQVTTGVYCVTVTIPCNTYTTPCMFSDVWSNITVNGICSNDVTNKFVLKDNNEYITVGPNSSKPKHYGYSVSGIKMDEKITGGDVRKVTVSTRKQYSTEEPEAIDLLQYRIYVSQGTTQVETHPWTDINIAYNQNYFIVDTGDMIPNEYHIDIKAVSNQESNVYPKMLKFQVVNQANYFGNPPSDYRQ